MDNEFMEILKKYWYVIVAIIVVIIFLYYRHKHENESYDVKLDQLTPPTCMPGKLCRTV